MKIEIYANSFDVVPYLFASNRYVGFSTLNKNAKWNFYIVYAPSMSTQLIKPNYLIFR